MAKAPPPPGPAPLPVMDRQQRVPVWLILLGVLAFVGGCVLLYFDDGTQSRTTIPMVKPRADFSGPARQTQIMPAMPRVTGALVAPQADPAAASRGSGAPVFSTTPIPPNTNLFAADFTATLWREADAAGISRATFDRALTVARSPDPDVIALNSTQPEFDRTVGDYVTAVVNPERVAFGRARLDQLPTILAEIERRYNVDRHVLLAIWGIESNFGAAKGGRNVIRSLATLAGGEPRRAATWRAELIAAMTILEQDKIAPEKLVGSWAGAMGHTQLMPSSYLKSAVDFDGSGRREVWDSVPNALASTARYLQAAGWVSGRPWGREVSLPADFDYSFASSSVAKTTTAWRILGVRPLAGTFPPDDTAVWQLIVPAGAGGPAFLVSQNFDALLSYNQSQSYALAVGTLADRIGGRPPIQALWPAGDLPMSRDQRVEMQEILGSLGFDPGPIDGIIGTKSREAIRNYQKANTLPADGHQSLTLLNRLRSNRRL